MCSRADVDGSIVRRNMGRPRRSTIASTAGVRREFGRASSRRRPNLLNRRNEWLSTARMSKRIAALAAEKGGASEQAIGITKGGRNSKIHGLVDTLCRPWVLILTPGNTADCTVGPACVSLLDGIAELLGDKAYDSNSFRKSLRKDGIKPLIPGRSNRKAQGLQAHRNALRQTRSELLLSPVPRCRRGIPALVVRGFRFWDNMASVSGPG